MSSFRNAIRFAFFALILTLPLSAYAATYNVQVFFDTDANRGTGCTLATANGPVSGIEQVLTTSVNVTGGTGTVTGVTRQVCTSGFFGSPIPVNGGWNVTVSPTGILFVETHVGANVMTMTNIGTMRLAFNVLSGTLSNAMTSDFGEDIMYPVRAGRRHAVTTSGPPRAIHLDGLEPDWNGVPILGYGDASSPALRFLDAAASADLSDLYFDFHIQTNPAAPTAQDDSYPLANPGSTLTVSTLGVLTNDSDPNHLPISTILVEGPEHGTLTLNANGGFTYVHDGSHVLEDHFRYRVTNGTLESNLADVSIGLPTFHPYVFTSADHVTFIAGQFNTFQVTVTGNPTPALSEDGALPLGVTFHDNGDGTGTLSGAPAASTVGIYPIVFHAEKNKPHQADQNFTLTVTCPGITVNNPSVNTGTVGTPFSQTFTQTGGNPPITWSKTGALPAGLTFNTVTGALSGTPTQGGTFPITVTATDSSGCSGTGSTYNLTIVCNSITVTNPVVTTGTVNVAFSQTFTQAGGVGATTFSLASGTLPAGLTLNASTGVLSGTPTQKGPFPIVVRATDSNGCSNVGPTYPLTINCQVITVTNPVTNTGTVNVAFSQTFTAGNVIAPATFTINSGTLPAGLTLSSGGVLSGTPTQTGSFPITVKATDANGCTGVGATYTLTIACQVITVTNPATNTGTVNAAFSQTFTAGNAIAPVVFTINSGTLPAGITLASNGTLSGTPTQTGSFPITVHVVDNNGCSANGGTYTLTIGCQVITVNKPATTTGTVNVAFSQNFTATNAIGAVTFTTASTLPTGITLAINGTLSGTPTQAGTFPIVVTATDANGCTGTSTTYTLVIGCQVITVTNPATTTGTVNVAFSQTFTSGNTIGAVTYSTASTLPAGLSLSAGGVLSGTPTQSGTFPIVVTATDANGCSGSGATYNLVIGCQVITVTNPPINSGTVNTAFSQNFTAGNTIGTVTFMIESGALPAGLTLSSGGVLSGTPTQTGSFPITVRATDANGCFGVGTTYTLTIGCQVITVTNPATTTGTVNTPFSQTFTAGNTVGTVTFTTASTLPAGLSLSSGGVLSGTPTQTGSFGIVVTATDGNGCTGTGTTYTLVIGCQTITVTNPANNTGTVNVPFSETFTAGNTIGAVTFTLNSGSLPTGLSLSSGGILSGTPTQPGSFPITVKATDANGCFGISATYTISIACQVITVNNPATTSSPAGTPISINFTQTGAVGTATFTTASTLPTGLILDPDGTLHGTPTQGGCFLIVVTVTDSNGCTGTNPPYTLCLTCPVITVTNPGVNTGTAGVAFSQTFTQSGGLGTITWSKTGVLPSGITLNPSTGVLSGTTSQVGPFPITVTATDQNGCTGSSAYTLTINCQTITVTNPGVNTGTVDAAFSQTFTVTGILGTVTWSETGALPAGITLNPSTGVLSGTPTIPGTFPITVTATDTNGCTGTSPYTLTINCQTITVTNPGVTTGTVDAAFSQTFTQSGVGTHTPATFTLNSGSLPSGLTLSSAGVLSGTPGQQGSFPITVKVTDANGCTGISATYTLVIACQTITVTNPATTTGTAGVSFSQTFTQSGVGTHTPATFTTASTLPTGFTLSTAGVLSGTTTQAGLFNIVVTVTDSNGCTGTGSNYPLNIACNTVTVTNPANNTGTVSAPFSETFTAGGNLGTLTFSLNSGVLPAGLSLSSGGVLAGTPTQAGSFPITVKATDANGCFGVGATYTITIACQTITVTNPANATGPAGTPFSETFTQVGGIGTITWSETGTLPAGMTFHTATGVLDGTPTQGGLFPITVTATDSNGCPGTGPTYNLNITCPTITVTNPATTTGTVNVAFSQTFTQSGGVGTTTFALFSGTLPAGLSLSTGGVLSGTPTQTGSFPLVIRATDSNGCTGNGPTYTLVIGCQVITVNNPATNTGTVNTAFSQTFTSSNTIGAVTYSTASALPTGLSLSAGGVLSGTPTQTGAFPIVVTATDGNGCTGSGSTYTLTIACQVISVTNPVSNSGTVGAPFSQTFTAGNTIGAVTFSLNSGALPAGLSLSSGGVLSGTPTQAGSFPITVKATDANGCFGVGATYTINIACQTITVTNPVNSNGTVAAPFSETFTAGNTVGAVTFSLNSGSLPTGLSLSAGGVLSGTPTQSGSFPITVKATDANGCFGVGATYTINIACNVITVTNPGVNTGTAGTAFSQTFTQSGGNGTIVWSETGTLPAGITLNTSTGTLFGTTSQIGSFPITVKATDANGCFGTSSYTLTINCQTITVTNPGVNTVQAGTAFDQVFTATGILGTATWSVTGTLPTGITLNTTTGHLAGTTNQVGSFPITVTATDTNTCFGTGATYTLTVTCPTITVARTGGGSFPAGIFNTAYTGQSVTATGSAGPFTFAVTVGSLPTGLSLAGGGAISGTPTATGVFNFTITATDTVNSCTGSQAFSISIAPVAVGDSYPAASHIADNTQFVITGGTTTSPTTPFVGSVTNLIANDLPSGGVTATPGTFATTGGGSVTIAADGTFIYTPKANPAAAAVTSDSFTYTVVSNGVTSAAATVNLTLANRVWYVNNSGAAGNGQSQSPFNTLAAAQAASLAGDTIFVYNGNNSTTGQNAGITLKNTQQLIGEGVALVVNTVTLVPAGTKPLITNTAGSAVTLANGNTVKGLNVTGPSGNGIDGTNTAGLTMDTMTIQGAGAASSGFVLSTPTGTITVTNTAISNSPFGLTINGGTAAFTMNNTNTISSNAGQRTINFSNLGATAVVAIGAGITDNGIGMQVSSSASGAQISFTGTQTLTTTTNTAVGLTTNTGAIITFSGTLGITTSTGIGFTASGGGTINVSGTANITTGAAANGLNLNAITIGASGVTFNAINTTGATTAINLVSFAAAGTVTVNGGTITNGTTGVSLQGANTSLSLAGVTITGPATGITNTTNFGTLTIGASVNVSATNALVLTTGAVSGTFANVTATAGGVSLTGVTGTWGATAGSLTGVAGSPTFNVSGGSGGTITWGATISQAAANTAVTIAGGNTNTINFGGTVTSQTAGTGITLTASSGTYNFNGGVTVSTGGVLISNGEAGTVTFANGSTITTTGAAASFQVDGSVAAVTTAITYSGTITRTAVVGRIVDVNKLNTPGTLTMSHAPAAAGNLSGNFNGAPATASGISVINSTSTGISLSNATLAYKNTDAVTLTGNTGAVITLNGLSVTMNGTGKGVLLSGAGTVNIGSGAAAPVINMSAGTNFGIDGTTTSFTGTLNLNNAAITGGGAAAVTVTGGGTGVFGGSGSNITNAGPALVLNGVALTNGAGMTNITSSGGANGISLTSVTGGTYTVGAGSLSGNTGSAFKVLNGGSTFSYAGTITQNTASQKAVDISGITAGTITLSSAIGSNGGTGISIAGSGTAVVTISGQITLNNTASVFSASGAGLTVNVTNANNTIGATNAVTTGTALSITNATIGGSGVTFKSVSQTGGTNGIVLTSTGAGSFTISGDGTAANNGSGGTIQTTTGDGILMTAVGIVSLNQINVTNPGLTGIKVIPTGWTFSPANSSTSTGVVNFTLNRCNISDNAGSVTSDDGLTLSNASGTVSITNDVFTNARHQGVTVDNFSRNMASFTMTGSTVTGTPGGDGILMQMRGTSVMTTGAFGGNTVALGNSITSNSATGLQVSNADTANIASLLVQNNTVSSNNAGMDFDLAQSSSMTIVVQSNTFNNQTFQSINLFSDTGSAAGTMTATLRTNTIGTLGVQDSGSKSNGNGIYIHLNGGKAGSITVDGNVIQEVPNASLLSVEYQAYTSASTMKIKIINNQLKKPTAGTANGFCGPAATVCPSSTLMMFVDKNNVLGATICTTISSNQVFDPTSGPNGAGLAAFQLGVRSAGNNLNIEGTQANARQQIITTNTITNPGGSPTTSDVFVDSGTPAIVPVGNCGGFPP